PEIRPRFDIWNTCDFFVTAGFDLSRPTGGETAKDDVNRRHNLGFFFDQSVARLPDKIAIIDLFGGRERCATYRQLDERMNGGAHMLAPLGVTPLQRVA